MIRRLLVANRGEVARRIFATCRAAGIETVAVYSDADAHAPHAHEADYAVHLPGNAPSATYLRADLLVAAARRTGADAIHPGYGFLAEHADFARAVGDAGLAWIGPPPETIAAMGSRTTARRLLSEAGIRVVPGYPDPAQVTEFPVVVRPDQGGSRDLRVARDRAALADAVAAARRDGGDVPLSIERYVERARHVEVQVLADAHGTVVALGERECSIQRRRQKLIEETPSAAVSPALREELCAASVATARALGYVGAGTVEFLVDRSGTWYALGMATRLQAEHPVTECVFGLDLVRLQLLVAEGSPLPFPGPPPMRGHAVEARLYAEDPAYAFMPATGVLHRLQVPEVAGAFRPMPQPGLRVDRGVADGDTVGIHYDPLLAKLIAWAPSRAEAARLLAGTLARTRVHGLVTNRDLLVRVLRHPDFLAGTADTGFLDQHPEVFAPLVSAMDTAKLSCLAAALASAAARAAVGIPSGWRNVPGDGQVIGYDGPSGPVEVRYRFDRSGALASWSVRPAPRELAGVPGAVPPGGTDDHPPVAVVAAGPDRVALDVTGVRVDFAVHRIDDVSYVDSSEGSVTLIELPRFPVPPEAGVEPATPRSTESAPPDPVGRAAAR